MISGIVLAAGESKRMGQDKLFLDFRGKPVLAWVLEAALASGLGEVICVVRELERVEKKIPLRSRKLRWVVNEEASKGQSTSIIAGLKAISPQSDGALFIVGDQPLIKKELIDGLVALFARTGAAVAAPTYQGETRNPVLFHRELFPELLKLTGDRGGKNLIEKHKDRAAFLEWHEESPFLDLDVCEDYRELKKR